ncbi:MAG: hypothetical protein FWG68_09735 [Defluviitaleaceae bacterium]|nr:hypothetical protein [Defluviitaleaceae bacterium]
MTQIKQKLLSTINTITPLADYQPDDIIFSEKHHISAANMTYILLKLSKDFNFTINADFVNSLEMCTFSQLEDLLLKYGNEV